MPSKTSLPPVLQSGSLRGKTRSEQKGPGQRSKGKKNKGTFVENRGTSVLVCRQHGSLSEPSRSWISHLCNGAQDGLAAAVWGRHHFPKTQLTTSIHKLIDRESRRGGGGGGEEHRECAWTTPLLYKKLFILLSRIKTTFIGIQHGFVMCHLGYSELQSLKFPFKCVSG